MGDECGFIKKEREKGSLRDPGRVFFLSLLPRSQAAQPAAGSGSKAQSWERAEGWAQAGGHGDRERCAERGEGAMPRTGLELLGQVRGCSLPKSSAEQMFPYLPRY